MDPRVTYLVVGRHPLDVAVSRYHHFDGVEIDGPSAPPLREWLLAWIDRDDWEPDTLNRLMWHLTDAWDRRDEPNVVLAHYDDLSRDLDGEMRRLAAVLGIEVEERTWPRLVEAATFQTMRTRAEQLVPKGAVLLNDSRTFFRKGTSGSGRALLTTEELARYEERAAQLAAPELMSWLHREMG
jgi:hypothetical protein